MELTQARYHGICSRQEAVVILWQRNEDSSLDEVLLDGQVFLLTSGHDVKSIGLAELDLIVRKKEKLKMIQSRHTCFPTTPSASPRLAT